MRSLRGAQIEDIGMRPSSQVGKHVVRDLMKEITISVIGRDKGVGIAWHDQAVGVLSYLLDRAVHWRAVLIFSRRIGGLTRSGYAGGSYVPPSQYRKHCANPSTGSSYA